LALAAPGVTPQEILAAELNFSAPSSLVLAAASWFLDILMWGWLLTQPPEAFHDQGGMAITFAIPLTLILWIVGGPVALALGQRGLDRVRPDKARDQWLALAGIALNRLMLWGGIVVPCLALWQIDS
jgi:hypothetical protein